MDRESRQCKDSRLVDGGARDAEEKLKMLENP